ncbi:toxin-antitoxin system YwqK family antitoxin [Kutzneria sp. CA-103260]|uniref:toxin-antitoxin system YwqK family antitoxin n=1 Tax=Kutzneria sp. CA-103260 TaxID=2802641 RepID=UPI001BA6EAAF|nr:hypothetical protein [Kutzneria sp. CA-103260]QUQ70818.1 MORN repeat variant [Kutzneria sp. CA-103260]
MTDHIDVQADEVDWDDSQRLLHRGVPFTGEAVTYNWLDEMTSLITYKNGIREGVRRTWYDGGQLKSEMTVHKGRMIRAAREWDQDGNLVRERRYDDTALVKLGPEWGTGPLWVDWEYRELDDFGLSDGLVALIEQWDDEFQAIYQPDDPPSSEFPDEQAEQRWLDRGRELARQIAPEVLFSAMGVRETIRRVERIHEFLDDNELDDWLRLTHDGEPFTGELVNTYGETLVSLTTYRAGWCDGPTKAWYEDGTRKAEGMNRRSKAVGVHRRWHHNGQLAVEKRFDDNGRLVAEEHWDEEGNPVSFRRTGMPE